MSGATAPSGMRQSGAGIDPQRHDAVVFDLDGVLTDTASVHSAAWRRLFDSYLQSRPQHKGEDHSRFTDADYRSHVDGKPRHEGVADFLASRGIHLPVGDPSDGEEAETVWGLGNLKNRYFHELLRSEGVDVFATSVSLVARLAALGVDVAVFSSSRNAADVLEMAGIAGLFPVRVDGVVAREQGLRGKPEPDVPLEASRRLRADPSHTVLVEDAIAGVRAGRRGGFGLVVGVARDGNPDALRREGADVVVADLADLPLRTSQRPLSQVPDALALWETLSCAVRHAHPMVFLDFDGTLSGIVDDPDAAEVTPSGRAALERLARLVDVAVVSGRDLQSLRDKVHVEGIWYAGSHGFEFAATDGSVCARDAAADVLPVLDVAEEELRARLADLEGALVERKRFAIAAHHRRVPEERTQEVRDVVQEVADAHRALRTSEGRRVIELRPEIDWHKGNAVRWLIERIEPAARPFLIYVGDDLTDEDALSEIAADGLGVVVRSEEHGDRTTVAHVAVEGPDAVSNLLHRIADVREGSR